MGRNCTVCTHPAHNVIDIALETGQPLREIAAEYSVSKTALHRHWHGHVFEKSLPVATDTGTSGGTKGGPRKSIIAKWGFILGLGLGLVSWASRYRRARMN